MSKGRCKVLSVTLVTLGLVSVLLLVTRASDGGDQEWSTDAFPDFLQGTSDGVNIWSTPGMAHLDRAWWPNARVNDVLAEGKVAPRVSFALTDTGGTSSTLFLVVWEDEHVEDHYPDVYFARSLNGGRSWSPNVLVSGAHQHGYSRNTPDIGVRATDGSFWAVWQDDRSDDGDIYYAVSHDQGTSWASALPIYSGAGKQLTPRMAPHGGSGYLYVAWEDERDDDGDIYVSRYTGSTWTTPVRASDCISNAEQREPSLAVDADGNAYAMWLDERERDQYSGDVYFSRWISGTAWGTWSTSMRLSDPTMDYADSPDIVAGAGELLLATWMERVPTDPATYDFQIVVARSEDDGITWERSVVHRLHNASASNASYNNPSIGVDSLGRAHVAWLHSPDQQAATANVLFSLSPDGGSHWTQPRVLNRPQNEASGSAAPALTVDFGGKVVVAWEDFQDTSAPQIYATGHPADRYISDGGYSRIFDANGVAAWGNITWTATTTPGTGLSLATRAMTSAAVGWTNWVTHTTSGEAILHPTSRFIQYRAVFTSTGSETSVMDEVVITYEQHTIFLPLVFTDS